MKSLLAIGLIAALGAAPAAAHEFLVMPAKMQAEPGEAIAFDIHSTHVFFKAEEMENVESVRAALVAAEGKQSLEVSGKEGALKLQGEVSTDGKPAWLTAHRLGQTWSKTPRGWFQSERSENPDAEFTNKYEKFTKVLVNAEAGNGFAMKPVGQALEIVPLTDPAALNSGEEIQVQVLHDGKPIAATVSATFEGFSETPNTFAYLTETLKDEAHGHVAKVKTWASGVWMIRVEHRTADTPGIDEHVLRSVMLFEVQ